MEQVPCYFYKKNFSRNLNDTTVFTNSYFSRILNDTTVFTHSHLNTSIGQRERANYHECFINTNPLYPPLVRVVHIQRHRTHLNSVSIIGRILKQTIIWIEHLTRQKEKELPRWSAIIQTETA